MIKFTWLGQAGVLLDCGGAKLLVDPYFSDSAAEIACPRKMPVDPMVWDIKPDLLLITHEHIDHYDPETVPHFVNENTSMTVLSPFSVRSKLLSYPGKHNLVQVVPGVVWTHGDVTITTVGAVHSDPYAVGFIVEYEGESVYLTGDTLFCPPLLDEISVDVDYVVLPVNGKGNNMNADDAAKFADYLDAKCAIPVHFGMLDDLNPEIFQWDEVIIPEIYKEIEL